jgi:hypothetical protein
LQIDGRYFGTPVKDRLCHHCNKIEDETHFFLDCNLHNMRRKSLLSKFDLINSNLSGVLKLTLMLKSTDFSLTSALGSFITKALKTRNIEVVFQSICEFRFNFVVAGIYDVLSIIIISTGCLVKHDTLIKLNSIKIIHQNLISS